MRVMKQKTHSAIMIAAMILAMLFAFNIHAFAAGGSTQTADSVAVVMSSDGSKTYYDTLCAAVENAEDGDTVALLKDVQLSRGDDAVTIDKDIALTSEDESKPCVITGIIGEKGSLLTIDAEVVMTDIVVDGTKEEGLFRGSLVTVTGGQLTLDDGAVLKNHKENSAVARGGAVSVVGGSLIMEEGSLISDCYSGYGGGVYIMNGKFVMNGGVIESCTAFEFGGGVYMGTADAAFVMNGGTISGNAADSGGGILIEGGTFTMNGGAVTQNSASDNGGGLSMGHRYTGGDKITVTPGGNKDAEYEIIYTRVNINGGSIASNTAAIGGGGIYMVNGDVYMTAGKVSENISNGNAGGVYVGTHTEGTFDMSGGTISGNTAAGYGGGVYHGNSDVIFNLRNGASISENQAQYGGGISMHSTGKFNSDGGIISNNTATEYGGGIYYRYNGLITMENGSALSSNKAKYGGAAFMGIGRLISYDSSITKNEATAVGGAIYCNGGQILLDSTTITDNSASSHGGIYSTPNTKVLIVVGDTAFSGNVSDKTAENYIQIEYLDGKMPITIGSLGEDANIPINVKNYSEDPSLLNLLIGIPRTLQAATDDKEAVYYTLTGRDVAKISVGNAGYMASLEDDNKVYLKYAIDVTLSESEAVYDGKPHYPVITVTSHNGDVMKEGVDYKVFFYDKDGNHIDKENMIAVGQYDIKIEPVNEDMANVWKVYTIKESQAPGLNGGEDESLDNGAANSGDDTNILLPMMFMTLSAIVSLTLILKRRRLHN